MSKKKKLKAALVLLDSIFAIGFVTSYHSTEYWKMTEKTIRLKIGGLK